MTTILVILLLVGALLGAAAFWTEAIAAEMSRLVPKEGRVTPVPGGSVHWMEAGPADGPVVLCIHGLAGNLRNFTYGMTAPLAEAGFRVVALDRPGCGWSERAGEADAALPRQAALVAAFMEALGIDRAVIVGHSLGGAVALQLAQDRPEKVAALALICPLTQPAGETPAAFKGLEVRTPWLRGLLARTLAVPAAKRMGEATLRAVFAPETPPADFLTRAGGALGLRPKGFLCASEDLCAVPGAMPALVARHGALGAPGGILFGAQDAILDPASGAATAEATGLAFETLPGRGHMIPITAPAETADFVRRMAARAAG